MSRLKALFGLAATLVLMTLGAGCGEKKRTEIVLGIATDLDAPSPLKSIQLKVFREGVVLTDQTIAISGLTTEPYELPGSYGVYSSDGAPDRFRVELTGIDSAGKLLVTRTAVLTLIPHKTLFVRLGVVTACLGKTDCQAGDTCIQGRCAPEEIDSSRLPAYIAGMERTMACINPDEKGFTNTSTKLAVPLASLAQTGDGGVDAGAGAGTGCDKGTCQEGVCLAALPGDFTPTTGALTATRSAANQVGAPLITLDDGRILIVGGLGQDRVPVLSSAEIYDPAKGTFTATGAMSVARVYFGQAKLPDGRVLIMGGINEAGAALDSAEIYDPKTGQFTATAAVMGMARTFPAAVTMSNGQVLVAGGMNQIRSYAAGEVTYVGGLNSAELYDVTTDTFSPAQGTMVEGRAYPSMAALPTGGAVVLCGQFAGAAASSTVERFDANMGSFGAVPVATLPAGAGCTAADLGAGKLLVMSASLSAAWQFDAATATFLDAGLQPSPRAQMAAVLTNGDVLFAGGTAGTAAKQAYLYSAASRDFGPVAGQLGVARTNFSGAALPSGAALIVGGDATGTAEVFHSAGGHSAATGSDGGVDKTTGPGAGGVAAGIYVGQATNEIRVFALTASGNVAPVRTIKGTHTGLSLPLGLGVDSSGDLYAANRTGGQVTVYPATSDGDVAPTRRLSVDNGVWSPSGLVVGTGGDVFVSTCPGCGSSAGGAIGVYHFAKGATTSDRVISSGANSGLTFPSAVVLGENESVIVSNSFGGDVATFASGASGDAAPVRSFTLASAANIQSLAYGASTLFLGIPGTGYGLLPSTTTGSATPVASIGPPSPAVSYPGGIFVDVSETPPVLYIADYGASAVYVVHTKGTPPNLSVASVTTIQGSQTALSQPLGILIVK